MPRPRIHPTNAIKQWAYRMRLKQRQQALEDAAARIHACLLHTPHAGHDALETLQNLAAYLEQGRALPNTTHTMLEAIRSQLALQQSLLADIQQLIHKKEEPNP